MCDEIIAKVAEQVPGVEDIENALPHILEDIGAGECVADFDDEFEAESIDGDMTLDGVPAIVLGATPPENAEWIESLDDL